MNQISFFRTISHTLLSQSCFCFHLSSLWLITSLYLSLVNKMKSVLFVFFFPNRADKLTGAEITLRSAHMAALSHPGVSRKEKGGCGDLMSCDLADTTGPPARPPTDAMTI